jgi:hypothetical protein
MSLLLSLALAVQSPPPGAIEVVPSPHAYRVTPAEQAAVRQAVLGVYTIISGPAGQKRDYAKMKALSTHDARLYAIGARGLQGGSLDDYIAKSGPFLEKVGFTERELHSDVQIFGNLAQVWSAYLGSSTDGAVNVSGINSIQLARQPDGRWLVHSILWQASTPTLQLPGTMESR